jgi:hypothetical protein
MRGSVGMREPDEMREPAGMREQSQAGDPEESDYAVCRHPHGRTERRL